jgi:hypothetical protein
MFLINRWNGNPEPSFDGLSVRKKLLTGGDWLVGDAKSTDRLWKCEGAK